MICSMYLKVSIKCGMYYAYAYSMYKYKIDGDLDLDSRASVIASQFAYHRGTRLRRIKMQESGREWERVGEGGCPGVISERRNYKLYHLTTYYCIITHQNNSNNYYSNNSNNSDYHKVGPDGRL